MIALPRLLVLTVVTSACWAKLCCDQECKKPVSYGRTKDRYITQEAGHLSFPNAAIVTILIKQAEFDSSGQELWFAEIQGRKGLVPAQVVTELHTLCEPKEISDDHLDGHGNTLHNSPPPPPPSLTPYDVSPPHIHQSGEPDSQTDVVLEQKQGPSRNNPVDQDREQLQTDSEHDDLGYGSPDEEPNNQELKEEKRNFNEDYVSNENQITQNGDLDSSDNDQYGVEYNEHVRDESTSYSVYHDSYDRQKTHIETHDQPSQTMEAISAPSSTLAPESISGTGESPNPESLLPPQDIDSGERNFDQMPSSELGESSQATLDKDVFNQEEHNEPESNTADKGKFGVPPSFNFQTLDEVSDETTASEVYNAGSSSNGIADYETPTAKGEAGSEHFDGKKVIPSYTSYETWSTGGVESVIEHTLTQDSPFHTPTSSYESHPGGEKPILVNLKNGESVRVVPLGGGNFQIKAEDGSVRLVDYDYFDDQGVELDYYDQYEDAGPDTEQEVMEIEENSPPKQILPENKVPIHTEVNEGYPAYDKELLPSHEAEDMPGYTPSPTKTGENHRHHSYLDVHSLQQRYKQTNTFEEDDINNMNEVILNEQTSANIKFTSTEDAQLRKTENLQVLNTPLASRDTEQGKVGETNKQNFEDATLFPLPDIERHTQPVSTSEEPDVKVHPQPTSQLFPDNDLEDDLKATHLPLPDVEQVSQQHESTRGQQQLPSLEHLTPENHKTTSTPIHTNVKSQEESDPQMPVINIVAQFSPQLAAWINDQGPEFGIIGVIASALCLILPLCCSCCHYWKDSRRKTLTLSKYTASRKGLEEQIEKLKAEKKSLNVERLLSEERFESLQNELEHMKYDNQTLTEAKVDIEENYGNVCAELHSLKQELSACTAQVNQIQSELKHERLQLCAETSEKEVALQQIALLQNKMRLYDQKVQELEAAKEQLEQDSYSTHNRFQELEELHKQVTEELAGSKSENAELNSKLQALQVEVSSLQQTRNDNNQEIQTLKDCLDQLVVSTGSHTGEQEEMTGGQTQNVNPAGTLLKIQAMLDTTKVQAELQAVTVERDSNISALEEQTRLVKKLQEENTSLREHSNEIEAQLSVCTADLQKLQEKHKTLTEYFEQKEHNLHRMLGAEEAVRQAVESREAQVKEKAQSLEQAETRHREELKQLRSEMFEIEKSLMSQVHTCQKRAEDAIAEQRRLEQECKALKLERDDLRKRMTVKSVSHLGGASDKQHSLIARPPSAPYLPRTSSPGVGDAGDHMTSLLNQTDPGPLPSTRPRPPFPITGRPEPSPFFPPPDQRGHFPPSQPPLQRPIPERERPRYPLPPPPPGRRLIRGYPPPFERRPPRPGVYGPGPRFYHDARDRVPERRRPVSNPPPGATPTPPVGVYDPHTSRNMHDSSTGFVPVAPAVPETTFQTDNVLNPVGEQVPLQRPESRKF